MRGVGDPTAGPGPAPPPSSEVVAARFRRQGRRDTRHELAVRRRLIKDPVPLTPRRLGASLWTGPTRFSLDCPTWGHLSKGNRGWWAAKLAGNAARDRRADAVLTGLGWRVLRFWEHEDPDDVVDAICEALGHVPAGQKAVSVVPRP